MKFSCGNHFLSEKQIRAERIRLVAAWSDYRAVGQAVALTVMELLDSKRSVTISRRRADQSLRATLFGLAPVWYRGAGGRWSDQRNANFTLDVCSSDETRENEAQLVFKLPERPDSPSEWDWAETLRRPLFTDCRIYRRSKRLIKGSKDRLETSAKLAAKKGHDVIAWNTVEGELAVTQASFTLHVDAWLPLLGGASPR